MTHPARYAITYTGNGIMRLPRAGIFQTGTRAVVDETVARIAVAHGCFAVVPLDTAVPLTIAPEATPIPAVAMPVAMPVAAAPAPAAAPARRTQRRSAVVRVPATADE
jgi:hypothetical protein